jgi:hypothetical protein
MPPGFGTRYPVGMFLRSGPGAKLVTIGLVGGLATVAVPASAERTTRARLVQCGEDSCLRLSGRRPSATTVVRVGGRDLAVEGGRAWRATVPLNVARTWPIARGYALRVVLADAGAERAETMPLPPGALGSRTQIASLVISAR